MDDDIFELIGHSREEVVTYYIKYKEINHRIPKTYIKKASIKIFYFNQIFQRVEMGFKQPYTLNEWHVLSKVPELIKSAKIVLYGK